jgi:hypothetical protein
MTTSGLSKLKLLEQEKARLETKISVARKAATAAARADDTRRKILIGSAVLAANRAGRLSSEAVVRLLDGHLERPADRAAFAEGPFALPPVRQLSPGPTPT